MSLALDTRGRQSSQSAGHSLTDLAFQLQGRTPEGRKASVWRSQEATRDPAGRPVTPPQKKPAKRKPARWSLR